MTKSQLTEEVVKSLGHKIINITVDLNDPKVRKELCKVPPVKENSKKLKWNPPNKEFLLTS
jgi:hypothetical protein